MLDYCFSSWKHTLLTRKLFCVILTTFLLKEYDQGFNGNEKLWTFSIDLFLKICDSVSFFQFLTSSSSIHKSCSRLTGHPKCQGTWPWIRCYQVSKFLSQSQMCAIPRLVLRMPAGLKCLSVSSMLHATYYIWFWNWLWNAYQVQGLKDFEI